MPNRVRLRSFLIVLILLSVGLVLFSLHKGRDLRHLSVAAEVDGTLSPADVSLEGVYLCEMTGSEMAWDLRAVSAEVFNKRNITLLNDVEINFFGQGDPIVVTGEKAKLDNDTREMDVTGNVVVSEVEGYTIYSDHLKWSPDGRRIYSDDFVRLISPDREISGVGFILNTDTKRFNIESGAKAVMFGKN